MLSRTDISQLGSLLPSSRLLRLTDERSWPPNETQFLKRSPRVGQRLSRESHHQTFGMMGILNRDGKYQMPPARSAALYLVFRANGTSGARTAT